ncbi:MAG: hypothetical protein V4714_08225 [Bacteroidota bacterium]
MPKTVGEWLYDMSQKTGVAESHEGLKPLLSISSIIPDDVLESLSGLMTIGDAKNNIKIKNHFISEFGHSIDQGLPEILAESGVSAEKIALVEAEKATGKKVKLAMRILNETKDELIKAKPDKDPEAITKANQQIKEVNEKYLKLEADAKSALAEKDTFLNAYKEKNELSKLVSSHKWSDLYPESVRDTLFDASLKAELAKLGAVMKLEGDKLVVKQLADPLLNFHFQNKEFTPSDLVAKVMTDNKFIAVAQKAAEPITLSGFRPVEQLPGGAQPKAPQAFTAGLLASLADQENAQ